MLHKLFDEALKFDLRITFEIENYFNRSITYLYKNIEYFHKEFWDHKGLYKVFVEKKNQNMPMIYIKNVEEISCGGWKQLMTPNGKTTLRRSPLDGIFIGHIRFVFRDFLFSNAKKDRSSKKTVPRF